LVAGGSLTLLGTIRAEGQAFFASALMLFGAVEAVVAARGAREGGAGRDVILTAIIAVAFVSGGLVLAQDWRPVAVGLCTFVVMVFFVEGGLSATTTSPNRLTASTG
jgi:hypothetical protein